MTLRRQTQMLAIGALLAVSVVGLPAVHVHADSKGGSGSSSGASCYNETTKRSTPNGQVEYVPLGDGVHSMAEGCDNGKWVMIGVVGALQQPSPTPLRPVMPLPAAATLGS